MNLAYFRFYEELNEFLPSERRKAAFSYSFKGHPSVKDLIEAIGVPHVEVDLILINSVSEDFNYQVNDGDYISVYPVFESIDISPVTHLRDKALRNPRFILDVHLGRLAKYMRLCGFDTLFSSLYDDIEIINISVAENRIILSRDKGLLKNKKVTRGYWVRSQYHEEQLKEVFGRFDLKEKVNLFTRCLRCNTPVTDVALEDIIDRLQPGTIKYFEKFRKCPECDRIYWNGSHYDNMLKKLKGIIE